MCVFQVSDSDDINTAIAKFRLNITNEANVVSILGGIRKKIHAAPQAAVDAARGHLASFLLECVKDSRPDDEVLETLSLILTLSSCFAYFVTENSFDSFCFK